VLALFCTDPRPTLQAGTFRTTSWTTASTSSSSSESVCSDGLQPALRNDEDEEARGEHGATAAAALDCGREEEVVPLFSKGYFSSCGAEGSGLAAARLAEDGGSGGDGGVEAEVEVERRSLFLEARERVVDVLARAADSA